MSKFERAKIGSIRAPSGQLLIADPGYLNLWSCRSQPAPYVSESGKEIHSVDFEITGPDAVEAGTAYDRQWLPTFLYDIPEHGVHDTEVHFAETISKLKLNASLKKLSSQIPHRQRFDTAIAYGNGAGEVQFHGLWSVALAGLPRHLLVVSGERFIDGPDAGRWRSISIECNPKPVATTAKVGMVMVDYARLLVADVDALEVWSDDSLDGKADIVFWGRDSKQVQELLRAPHINEHHYGWLDLPIAAAHETLRQLEDTIRSNNLTVKIDQRPHSHHHLLLTKIRQSETESGTLDLHSARLCCFMTTWGDGIFPVYRDLAADGSLVRVRLEVGNDEIIARQRKFDELWIGPFAKFALVSKQVWEGKRPVFYLYRESPDNNDDSGWRIFAGDESDEYINNADNVCLIALRDMIARDKALKSIFRTDAPCAFGRNDSNQAFEREDPS